MSDVTLNTGQTAILVTPVDNSGQVISSNGLLPTGTSITRSESLAGNVLTETFTYASGATTIGTVVVVTTAGKFTSATWS